jgi:hypothetical protein
MQLVKLRRLSYILSRINTFKVILRARPAEGVYKRDYYPISLLIETGSRNLFDEFIEFLFFYELKFYELRSNLFEFFEVLRI